MNPRSETEETFIDVPGGHIYARQWVYKSTRKKSPIILLHESLGCIKMWRDFPKALSEKTQRSVIAYDRLGFGESSPREALPSNHFIHEEAEIYFPRVLEKFNVDAFSIFGHSVGGCMAVICARLFPKRCEAIVTESAQAFIEDKTLVGIHKAKAFFEDYENFSKLEKYHGDKASWVLRAWIDVWLSPGFAGWSLKDDLPKVTCPILAIHGDNDDFGSAQFPETICRLSGGPTQMNILPNTGHVPHKEQPEVILNLVHGFLSSEKNTTPL